MAEHGTATAAHRLRPRALGRPPAGTLDLVLAVAKSVSAYYAALRAGRRYSDAVQVVAAHRDGVRAALAYLDREAAWALTDRPISAAEYLARALDAEPGALPERRAELEDEARSAARAARRSSPREPATGLDLDELEHRDAHDAPGRPPHLHTHLLVRPTVLATGDGRLCRLDETSLVRELAAAAAVYELASEESLMRRRPVRLERRAGSTRRELAGVKPDALLALRGSRCRPHPALRQIVLDASATA